MAPSSFGACVWADAEIGALDLTGAAEDIDHAESAARPSRGWLWIVLDVLLAARRPAPTPPSPQRSDICGRREGGLMTRPPNGRRTPGQAPPRAMGHRRPHRAPLQEAPRRTDPVREAPRRRSSSPRAQRALPQGRDRPTAQPPRPARERPENRRDALIGAGSSTGSVRRRRARRSRRRAGEPRAEAGRGDRQRGARRSAPRVVELGEVEGEGRVVERAAGEPGVEAPERASLGH